MSGVLLFPVRHHSPRASLALRAFLDANKPKLVMVEGPADAGPMIQALLDPGTVPPVAILGYRTDGTPGSALWPFATYSPEYQALLWAKQNNVEARFVDITVSQSLAESATPPPAVETVAEEDSDDTDERDTSAWDRAAERRGFRSFEEMWEADFEAPNHDVDGFRAALIAWADAVRSSETGRADFHRARDAVMQKHIDAATTEGFKADTVALVAGAAHIAALALGDVERKAADRFGAGVPSATTIIPYSFTRLAGQTGYGAGNRAPRFYQRAFDAGGDYQRATLEVLVEIGDHLRLAGYAVSLADTIEAYRLAMMLAEMRRKLGPGLDEVREAVVSAMCRGESRWVDKFLWPMVVGHAIGKVASSIGKNSLQQEFWNEVQNRRLPQKDDVERFLLKMSDPVQVDTSVFLHRLRVLEVPYASYVGSTTALSPQRGGGRDDDEAAGGISALTRVKENWEAQWTPATDVALVEKIVLGDTLKDVSEHVLTDRLRATATTGTAASVLLEAVVCGAPRTAAEALAACESYAATDDDLPSLTRATRALSGLVSFGSSRSVAGTSDAMLQALAEKTYARACLRAPLACVGNDDAVVEVKPALRVLHEVALGSSFVDKQLWLDVAKELRESQTIHPTCAGLAAGLSWLAGTLTDADVAELVTFRLSSTLEPRDGAAFLEGFLEVNALVLVRARPVVQALDAFLQGIPGDRFKDTLPVLRRAFASLGQTERRYLLENVLALRVSGEAKGAGKALVEEKDKEKVKEIAKDLGKLMDDLDDLL